MTLVLTKSGAGPVAFHDGDAECENVAGAHDRNARFLLFAAICGFVAVAAIKLVHWWIAQTPMLDFAL